MGIEDLKRAASMHQGARRVVWIPPEDVAATPVMRHAA